MMRKPWLTPRIGVASGLVAALLTLASMYLGGHALAQTVAPSATPLLTGLSPNGSVATDTGFTFTLTAPATTSAGVYRDGLLIKTLWSNRRLTAGSHSASWDGTTDEVGVAPSGRYTLTVLANDVQYTWDGVIGNTSESFAGPTKHHAQDIQFGMAVAGGNIYIATGYNEARASTFKVAIGNPQSKTTVLPTAFRYTGAATFFVAADNTTVYWAGLDPNHFERTFVFASRVADDSEVVFGAGTAIALRRDGHGAKYKSVIGYVDRKDSAISGLAVQKAGRFLFIARESLGRIDVLDKSSGAPVRSVALDRPNRLAVEPGGALWAVVLEDGRQIVRRFDVAEDGSLEPGQAITGLAQPLGISVSPDGAVLLVADGGDSQQVKAFDVRRGDARWVLGRPGGFADGPAVADDKFMFHNFSRITFHQGRDWSFVAFQPDGSFWVGDAGNNRAQHYGADRKHLRRLMWMPLFYSATADPNDPRRVFGNLLEFEVDYARPLAPDNGSWRLVRNWGFRLPDRLKDKYAYALHVATLSNGRTYAQFRDAAAGTLELAELVPAAGLRFTGIKGPDLGDMLHPDGSLRATSQPGRDRPVTWSMRDLDGFDAAGNPRWGPRRVVATLATHAATDPLPYFSVLPWAWERTSSGALVVFDAQIPRDVFKHHPVTHDGWHLGGLDVASGRWLWKSAPSTMRGYHGDWPTDGAFDIGNHVLNAGTRAHVVGSNVFWHHCGEGWKGGRSGQINMWTHVHESGLLVGQFGALQRTVRMQEVEGQPGMAGNASAHRIVAGPEGELYVYHNDEGYHGGVHRWRIDKLASIGLASTTLEWNASRYRPRSDPADLLASVPRAVSLRDGDGGWRRAPEADIGKDRVREWFHAITSVKRYRRDESADIEMRHVGVPSARVWRQLTELPADSQGWTLSATLGWSWENHGEIAERGSGGTYVEVLDGYDRVIARVWPKRVRHPDDLRLLANGETLVSARDQASFIERIEAPLSLEIRGAGGAITFVYDREAPVVARPLDPSADWRRPMVFRIQGWSNNAPSYQRTVNLTRLRLEAVR
jgi:hypothetical protein